MGLFDIFKKKETKSDVRTNTPNNNVNSVFTLRFTVPFFQIFDKTDEDLKAYPIRMSVDVSCQTKITEPELCFDNIPLKNMTTSQLEELLDDTFSLNVKTFFNSISSIPVLQFGSVIDSISDALKGKISKVMLEEYGLNLRSLHISEVRYDVVDPNYRQLQALSQKKMNHRLKRVDTESDIELDELKHSSSLNKKRQESALQHEIQFNQHELDITKKKNEAELEHNIGLRQNELDFQKKKNDLDLELTKQSRQNALDMENLILGKTKEKES